MPIRSEREISAPRRNAWPASQFDLSLVVLIDRLLPSPPRAVELSAPNQYARTTQATASSLVHIFSPRRRIPPFFQQRQMSLYFAGIDSPKFGRSWVSYPRRSERGPRTTLTVAFIPQSQAATRTPCGFFGASTLKTNQRSRLFLRLLSTPPPL